MCGVAAAIGIDDAAVFATLFGAIRHRGPDESGIAESGAIRLGTHRLAIVGHDGDTVPLYASGSRVLAFNGEIYNHRELRREFADYPFQTGSDGEVLFPLLARHGLAGLRRLRGMFAFIHANMDTGEFIAARDPFGIKPLYFAPLDGGVAFASELKSFAALPCIPQFVPPGHFVTRDKVERWYQVPGRFWRPRHRPLRQLLEQAVASHLPESGPCGVFLSGGLDSSIIAALAARIRPDIVAYTVVFPGSEDEGPAAEMAQHLGIRHVVVRESGKTALAPVIGALENYNSIMVRNGVPLYLLSQAVEPGCKVILGGDGSDELFAGYDYLDGLPRRHWQAAMDYGLNNLHRTELQRVDRMTMAHGIELRVPFLDLDVAEAAIDLPLSHKIGLLNGRPMTKWALREAVTDLLPPAICWRQKTPLADGSGFSRTLPDNLSELWRAHFPNADTQAPIWSDAGLYTKFRGNYGRPLLQLFRG
jgi:asparagine synthase (glutamine-hydrolysing)